MLGDLEGELHVFELGRGGRTLGDHLEFEILDHDIVARLDEQAARDGLGDDAAGARIGKRTGGQKAEIGLGGNDRLGLVADRRCDDHLGEELDDLFRGGRVEHLVERDDAAEGRGGIAGEGPLVGLDQARAGGDAAGVGVLDDRAGRALFGRELGNQLEGRIRIIDVVVGELLALKQGGGGNARTLVAGDVEAGALVRVFAVAHGFLQHAADAAIVRHVDRQRLGEPVGDHRVIGRRARKGLGGELLAQRVGGLAVVGLQRLEQDRIVGRVGEDRDIGVVLGRGADHGRAANVDVFDRGRIVAAGGAHFLERVEVDDGKIDRLDAVGAHGLDMLGIVADGQQAPVHIGVQRLDATVHDLREAGDLGHIDDRQAGSGDRLVRATGRQELHAHGVERPRQFHDAALVGDGQERGADLHAVGNGDFLGCDGHGSAPV